MIRVDAIVRMDERIIRREIFAITAEGVKTVLERLLALKLWYNFTFSCPQQSACLI